MKTMFKVLALLLAVLMSLSAFVACDNSGNKGNENDTQAQSGENTTAATETQEETEATPDVAVKDYGTEFLLSILPDVNPMKYYWVEESENDVMSEALYARQQKVLDYLGVEIIGSLAGNYQTYTDGFKTSVKNKDGSVDTLITHVDTGVTGLITEAYVRSFDNMTGIDLDQDHWNISFMDTLSIADKHYLGFSDFNILYTNVITFNKDMMDKYADALETSVYDMVRNYTWTLDQMIELVNLVYVDATADGKTEDDTFGLVGMQWVPWIGFLHASNINLVEMDSSGQYKVSVMNDLNKQKTSELVDKLTELSKSNSTYLDYMTAAGSTIQLTSGRALMELTPTISIANFLDYDISFGVLPYPVWDTAQKDVGYRHLQWGGYLVLPNYLADEAMVGDTLEVLSFYSKDVQTAFYEKLLGKQVADVPDDSQMLSIVWDTVCTDIGQTFSGECPGFLYMLPHVTYPDSGHELASYVKQHETSANKSLTKFLKKMEKIGG